MISVVIPARDEERTVGAVVAEVRAALAGTDHEVLVVDDASCDATAGRARAAGARVLAGAGLGYGAAVKAGARAARGELLALLDADGTYPASELPRLVAAVAGQRALQAIGARPAWGSSEPWLRSAAKAAFRAVVRWLGGLRVPDLNSGMRVVPRALVLELAPLLPDRFSLTTTLTLAAAARGERLAFVPIEYRPRAGLSKWRPVRDTLLLARAVGRGIVWLRRGRRARAAPVGDVAPSGEAS